MIQQRRQRQILGLDVDLLIVTLIMSVLFAALILLTGCQLFASTSEAVEQTGQAAEDIGEAVAQVSEAASWAIYMIVGYVLGELRRPGSKLAKKVLNGNSKLAKAAGDKLAAKRVRGV